MFNRSIAIAGRVPNTLGALGQTYAMAGMEQFARVKLTELTELSEQIHVPATCFALIHIGLGENDLAVDYLVLGASRRDLALATLKVHPAYDSIRSEPRFQNLLHQIGFN